MSCCNGEHQPECLRAVLGIPFTEEQLRAATAPLAAGVIVAGAGAGKTTVMAARVVWLVLTGQVRPDQVLGLTFTNKAAGELAERVRRSLARAGIDLTGDLEPRVLTYNAYAARLVDEHGLRLGIEPSTRLLADATRFQLAERVVRRAPGPYPALTGTLAAVTSRLVSLDSDLSDHLREPQDLAAFDSALAAAIETAEKITQPMAKVIATCQARTELADLVGRYREAKREGALLDFSDQVAIATMLAEQMPEVAAAEREQSAVVLLDEYQDTSVAQRRMLTALFGDGFAVTAVGDPSQAIYGWRGASVSNIARFRDHFSSNGEPAAQYTLATNQRSGGRLLEFANQLAGPLRERTGGIELPVLTARPGAADEGQITVALLDNTAEELSWLAGQIAARIEAGTAPGEIAVLVRRRATFGPIHAALTAAGIPCEVIGLGGLLELPEVVDVVSVLEVLADSTNNPALLRILTGPRYRIGARDLAALGERAHELAGAAGAAGDSGGSIDPLERAVRSGEPSEAVALIDAIDDPAEAPISPEARQRIAGLRSELARLRRHADEPLLDLIMRIVATIGLDVELAARSESGRDNLQSFIDVAAGFSLAAPEATAASFVAFLDATTEYERGLDIDTPPTGDAVALLTVHKAKGLEWDVVALPDLTKTVFPATTLRSRWTTSPGSLPGPLRGDAEDLPVLADPTTSGGHREFEAQCREQLEMEELRLGYVAVTRARHEILASSHWWSPDHRLPRGPSPYLLALKEYCSKWGGVDQWIDTADDARAPDAEPTELRWPPAPDPHAMERIRALAEAVEQARSAPPAPTEPEEVAFAALDADLARLLAEARERSMPRAEVVLPEDLTASQIVLLERDPALLAQLVARPLPARPIGRARAGTRFHAWVEQYYHDHPLVEIDDLPGAQDDDEPEADLDTLKDTFRRSQFAKRRPLALEVPFEITLAGHVLRGRIDAVFDEPDGQILLVDWKTGRGDSDPIQLAVYRLGYARLRGIDPARIRAAFYYVARDELVYPPALWDAEQLAAALAVGWPHDGNGADGALGAAVRAQPS